MSTHGRRFEPPGRALRAQTPIADGHHRPPMFRPQAVDYGTLEGYLRALAFEIRLEILHKLRLPHTVAELKIQARRHRKGEKPDRLLARQSVQEHVDHLVGAGLVEARQRPGGSGQREYVVNGPRLYQVLEDFRQVGTVALDAPPRRDETDLLRPNPQPAPPPGPHLALAHGLMEGRVFLLSRTDLKHDRGWVIGRKPDLHVSLEYDPYVSLENSEILPDGDGFLLTDLRGSKNGTWLNWAPLEKDEPTRLRPGDFIGVGRSLLVYRPG